MNICQLSDIRLHIMIQLIIRIRPMFCICFLTEDNILHFAQSVFLFFYCPVLIYQLLH